MKTEHLLQACPLHDTLGHQLGLVARKLFSSLNDLQCLATTMQKIRVSI